MIGQKTKIQVSESGTEAAAVTYGLIKSASMPLNDLVEKEVNCNRPFAFLIYDEENQIVLFQGKVVNIQ